MRFERGPFGRIAVITVESEADVILHALDVLQNHVIPSILPVYLREQMGKIQLCIDCTGFTQLSDMQTYIWENPNQKRKCVAEFLQTLIYAQDHFIDSALFVMDPEFVFFDTSCMQVYWCCIPIIQNNALLDHNSLVLPWGKLELLLMNPFFCDIMEEDERNQILCMFRNEQEDELIKFLIGYTSVKSGRSKSVSRNNNLMIRLIIQFFIMSVCFAVCYYLVKQQDQFALAKTWSSWYVLVFTFLLIISLMSGRGKFREQVLASDEKAKELTDSLSRKEMYFPSCSESSRKFNTDSLSSQFSPAFLTQQVTQSTKDNKPLRAVIWVDDFLIGRDESLCDLFLDDASVSDRHARILHRDPIYYLVDLGSVKGTWIGSRRLYSFEESSLTDGDIFKCGDIRFVFNHTS